MYNNGDVIPTTGLLVGSPKNQWPPDSNEINVAAYGRLYTWYAATDNRNVCSTGWHLPTDEEWTTLTDYLTNNGYGYDGSGSDIAKSLAATSGWSTAETNGVVGNNQRSNNRSGFSALPSGNCWYGPARFYDFGFTGYWWTSTQFTDADAYGRLISNGSGDVYRYHSNKGYGYSVRCVKDN
jgi:uncharacterized protein (TIGR02145 family)